jgi:hypothetical protein
MWRVVCVISKILVNEEAVARVGLQRHVKKIGADVPHLLEFKVLHTGGHTLYCTLFSCGVERLGNSKV